jgi:hemoglobin-like flavoprotein
MDKQLLSASLLLVAGEEDALTRRFYEILFERYPGVQPMFARDVRAQASMLTEAIVAVLDHLDDSDWLTTSLASLGVKHAGYGVTADMYPAVGECMIAAMSERGGADWTPEMTAAWTEALAAVSVLMLAGAADAEAVA